MAFPYMNAKSQALEFVNHKESAGTSQLQLVTGLQPILSFPGPVDVSTFEFTAGVVTAADTGVTRSTASGASTVVIGFADGGPSGDNATPNLLFDEDMLSNTITGGWTVNVPRRATGTGTVDLDADDYLDLRMVANISGPAGLGAINVAVAYVYGVPSAIN